MHAHFLLGLYASSQARRSRIVYAVLKNEMTVSAEYWALRYNLLQYVRVLPEMPKRQFNYHMDRLVKTGALREVSEGMYIRTDRGDDLWETYRQEHYQLQQPNVFANYNVANFMQVMLLANQVVSEWSYNNKTYYPMQIDQQQMALVKQWFQQQDKETLVAQWQEAISNFLATLDEDIANQFVATWSGHDIVGFTTSQLSLPESWDEWDITIWQRDMYAQWLRYMEQAEYSPIHELAVGTSRLSGPLTKIQKSFEGLKAGLTEEEIAQQQRLKLGTIREHLLTAAIWFPLESFPYEVFLTDEVMTYFEEKLRGPIDEWRFTMVRMTGDPYEFLVFRLYQIWLTKQKEA